MFANIDGHARPHTESVSGLATFSVDSSSISVRAVDSCMLKKLRDICYLKRITKSESPLYRKTWKISLSRKRGVICTFGITLIEYVENTEVDIKV